MIWVVACKFDPERPVIFDCVASIREHHPDDWIFVVDSASDQRTYLAKLHAADEGVEPVDLENEHYALGAYGWAQENIGSDFYACIHDSLIVNQNLHHLEDQPLTTVRYFEQPPNAWGVDGNNVDIGLWGADQAREHLGLDIPAQFAGVLGPMWFCQRQVMDDLDKLGFFNIKPSSKFEQQGTERLAGIALTHLGYDVRNSLQGEMHGFFDVYDSTFVEKRHLDRV